MAISSQKLLPQAGSRGIKLSSSMVKVSNVGAVRKFSPSSKGGGGVSGGALVPIYGTLVKINGIISKRAKEETKEIIKKRDTEDKKEKEKEEKQLESKSKKNTLNLPKPRIPGMSFLDRLKNALTLLFVGWLVNTFFDYLPKIMEGVSNFLKGVEILQKYLSPITNALGSALYNVTLAGTKMLGSITGAQIDKNEKDLAVAINEIDKKFSIIDALMAGIIIGDIFSAVADGLDLFERPERGGGGKGGPLKSAKELLREHDPKRALIRQKYGDAFARLYDLEKAKGLNSTQATKNVLSRYVDKGRITPQRMMGSLGGTESGSKLFGRGLGRLPTRLAARVLGRGGLRLAGKVFGRIPIIGGLIDFIINLAILREKPGRAAAKAVGATLGAGLGTLIPVPFAGTILGGFLGDLLGGAVYDMFANKPDDKKKGPKKKTEKPKGYFFGGLVSGVQNFFSGKPKSTASASRGLGSSQKAIQQQGTSSSNPIISKISADPQLTDRIGEKLFGGFTDVANLISSSAAGIGPFAALGISLALGKERFSKSNALGIAAGIGNLLGNPLAVSIYNFLDKTMPGLGNLVQKVVGRDFGLFLSNAITQFLGKALYDTLSPLQGLIKFIMLNATEEAKKAAGGAGGGGDKEPDGSAPAPVNVPTGKDDKIKAALAFYKSKGFSDTGAAYMVGNLLQESGLRPDAIGDNGKAFGLAQWRIDPAAGARWLGYQKWAEKNNKQIGDFYAQLEYTIVEGQTYNAGLSMMKGNDKSAHKKFIKGYEGYSVEGNRFGFAEDILKNAEKYNLGKDKKSKVGAKNVPMQPSQVKMTPSKPYSPSATSYSGVSRFASYDRPLTKLQVVRQIVYVPMNQNQSGRGMIVADGGGVNNNKLDYEIAVNKATA